jgi:DNA processing protein
VSADVGVRIAVAAAAAAVEPARLARRMGGCVPLMGASSAQLRRMGVPEQFITELQRARKLDVGAYRAELGASGITCHGFGEPGYPAKLSQLADPPVAIFTRGVGAPLASESPSVSIVGSRHPSDHGLVLTRELAQFAAINGVAVVSGIALGIDAAAHAGALAGGGPTYAVLGCGVDVVYPRTNARLFQRVLERGLVMSEYPPGVTPAPWRFPARNRIIAALSETLLVVEARSRSGALITADQALDLGRDVLAVPGSPAVAGSAGTNGLIKAGAGLIENTDDFAGWLGIDPGQVAAVALPERLAPVMAEIARGAVHLDALCERLHMSAGDVAAAVTQLEIDGWALRDHQGRIVPMRRVTAST